MKDECVVCRRPESHGFSVQQCDRCDEYVCENHAEVDYSMEGDPGYYVNTQWVCEDRTHCQEVA